MRTLFVIVFFLAISLPVAAEEQTQRAVITYQGVKGFFFSEEIGTKILQDLEELKVLRQKVTLLDEKLSLKDDKIKIIEYDRDLSDQIAAKWKISFEEESTLRQKEIKNYQDLLSTKDAWYNSDVLWFGVGFVVASAVAIGMAYGLGSVRVVTE